MSSKALIARCQRSNPAPVAAAAMSSKAAFSLPAAASTLATCASVVR